MDDTGAPDTPPDDTGDPAADRIRAMAQDPPAKRLDTVKAASDALEKEQAAGHDDARVEARAETLWRDAGERGSVADYRDRARSQLAAEDR